MANLEDALDTIRIVAQSLTNAAELAEDVASRASTVAEAASEAADALDRGADWDGELSSVLDDATAAVANLREAVERLSDDWDNEVLSHC